MEKTAAQTRFPDLDLPDDYECCNLCDFDHGYDYESAAKAHSLLPPFNPNDLL